MKLRFSSPLLKTAIPDVKVVVGAKPHRPVHHIYTERKIIQHNVSWDLVLLLRGIFFFFSVTKVTTRP